MAKGPRVSVVRGLDVAAATGCCTLALALLAGCGQKGPLTLPAAAGTAAGTPAGTAAGTAGAAGIAPPSAASAPVR